MHLSVALQLFRRDRKKAHKSHDIDNADGIPATIARTSAPKLNLKLKKKETNKQPAPRSAPKPTKIATPNLHRRLAHRLRSTAPPVQASLDSVFNNNNNNNNIAGYARSWPMCTRCVSRTSEDRTVHFADDSSEYADDEDDDDGYPSTMSAGARLYHECKAIRDSDVFPLKEVVVNDVEDDNGLTVTRIPVPTSTPVEMDSEDGSERLWL